MLVRMIIAGAMLAALVAPAAAQQAEDRTIAFGRDIFREKAGCQFCHKWDGGGDQGYGGIAFSLRGTQLDRDQLIEVVRCGRPGTGMPYHDAFAYTDKRCYGVTKSDLGDQTPHGGQAFLQLREVQAVVDFVLAEFKGKGPADYAECQRFWGTVSQQCAPLKQ
jgi:hypothetical protein